MVYVTWHHEFEASLSMISFCDQGKPGQGENLGISLDFPDGDKTFVEVTSSPTEEEGAEGTTSRTNSDRRGTLYVIVKEIGRQIATKVITCTGHKIHMDTGSGSAGGHSFRIEAEGAKWSYILKDRTEAKLTTGNFVP